MQDASIVGAGNSVVQIVGDGNTVTAGCPHLTLTRYVARRQIRQDLDRLSPYTRSTPLLGREMELASLHTFLNDLRAMSARVLIGGGGSGKTRLALELCEQASSDGWNAGFVTRTELHRFFGQQNLSDWGWQNPTLIVVDYAAEHAELLSKWLDELTDRAVPPKHVLRLLLLERHATTETGWWTTVFASGGWGVTSKRALLDPSEPVSIRPITRVGDRLALLDNMLAQASPDRLIDLPMHDDAFRDKLMQLAWGGDPLFLMMGAFEMIKVGHASALALGRIDLADALAKREIDRLQQLAQPRSLDPALVQHLAACVTLAQGMSREDFERFASSEKAAINRPSGGDPAVLADLLELALPRINGIAPLLPDLIGEALVMRTMRQDAGALAVLRCHAAFGRPVTESVIRCAQDFAQHSRAPLHWLEGIIDALGENCTELAALDASLPMDSVVLRDVNLRVAERVHALCTAGEEALPYRRAASLSGLAIRLALVGQRERALQAAHEEVELYRALAAEHPDAFRPDLALSLNNLANRLSELGRQEPALPIAQEAFELYRELATERPDVFGPDLAMSLNNLANRLSELGRHEPALPVAQEAVALYRKFAAQRLDMFGSDLAMSLNNLALRLNGLGRHEPAVPIAREAVELYRVLAAERPDVFGSDLAMSLNNLALGLIQLGQHEPALQTAQQAAELYRTLATERPEVFRPALATSLFVLSLETREVYDAVSALPVAREAVATLAPALLHLPDAHARLMGALLDYYLQLCESSGRGPDAELIAPLMPYFTDEE
ncbi:hypothetical protein NOV72_05755 [Caballeronia novacaledonica]|uniref:Tetratricopeptide repeat protein n=1 Tax=Caballeronia novacaledonica TaxID=1544861 RepID=A0A2U3IEK7_9BURK|nr:tetratricopeptide repeat protein [Caballeronia novacaledonica]SPB18555.1 hypothetical protein NOV72_05755 [Caballeronia novacaledonica]